MNTIEIILTAIGTAAAVIGSTGGIMVYLFKREREFAVSGEKLASLERCINSKPCKEHHEDLIKIKTILVTKFPYLEKSLSMKASPRKLNPVGERLFNDINGQAFLDEHKERLFEIIDNAHPLVPYDVQQEAMTAFVEFVPTPAFNNFKNFVYNAPEVKLEDGTMHAYDIPDICFVLGLRLRDMYLEAHPEISGQN